MAIAARKIEGLDPLPVLVEVLSTCGEDRLIPAIVWQNLHPLLQEQGDRFVRLIEGLDLEAAPALAKLLPQVVDRLLGEPDSDLGPVRVLIERLVAQDPGLAQRCLAVVSDQAGEVAEGRRRELRSQLQPILRHTLSGDSNSPLYFGAQLLASRLGMGPVDPAAVRDRFTSPDGPEAIRLQALEALIAFEDPALPEAVDRVLAVGSAGFLTRVLAALGRSGDPGVAEVVLRRYPALAPELQPLAVDLLLQREPWGRKLLDAVLAEQAAPQHAERQPPAPDPGGQRPGGDLGGGEGVGDDP